MSNREEIKIELAKYHNDLIDHDCDRPIKGYCRHCENAYTKIAELRELLNVKLEWEDNTRWTGLKPNTNLITDWDDSKEFYE